ncbi:aminotransferase DegT [Bacillus sp. 7504-2]|nr:aminotransferase DegT [Bacillus sp. 7504-2]
MIPVSQPFLPPKEEYDQYISQLWDTKWLTNQGIYVQQLESELKKYCQCSSLFYVNNGTSALHLAIKGLGIKNEVITTPFSFVATTTSILWENCTPVFVDIDPTTFCIDAEKIEAAITDRTEAILATHVFGIPCEVERIEEIARKHNLLVIYDAAHAFGVQYKGRSLLTYGDLSTISFHATKLFHTVEGGAIMNNTENSELDQTIQLMRNFGFVGENYAMIGLNGKNSEFHAAMGLCNLKYVDALIEKRKELSEAYRKLLGDKRETPDIMKSTKYNYAYYPILFETEGLLLQVQKNLRDNQIASRRYFYPSLNTLPYVTSAHKCPVSEDISRRILCLPLYSDLTLEEVEWIAAIVKEGQKAVIV